MIKQKFDEPKEQIEKEINKQKDKLTRIKKAYINGAFDIDEYNEEKKIVEKNLSKLETDLENANSNDELKFTPQDILLKRDIDYINKIKLEKEYKERTKTWKDYTREEKSNLIMRYVDEIKLGISGKEVYVAKINFRESFIKPYDELWNQGYLDIKTPFLLGNVAGTF